MVYNFKQTIKLNYGEITLKEPIPTRLPCGLATDDYYLCRCKLSDSQEKRNSS